MLKILESLYYLVIAPVKGYFSNEEVTPTFKENIQLTDLLPAHLISPLVDFSITYGGEGTVQIACLSGHPFIGMGLQYEQETNVHNCQLFGNAIGLSVKSITKASLEQAITLVESEKCKEKVQEMKVKMNINSTKNTADFIKNNFFI